MVGQVAFFLLAAGVQIGNTVTTSYIIDAYPLQSMSIVVFYSVFLNFSAFVDPVCTEEKENSYYYCYTNFVYSSMSKLGFLMLDTLGLL